MSIVIEVAEFGLQICERQTELWKFSRKIQLTISVVVYYQKLPRIK